MRKRKSLHAEFNAAKQENLPMPRQNYGIDFYGHHNGNILVAIDLVTREIALWFMKTRQHRPPPLRPLLLVLQRRRRLAPPAPPAARLCVSDERRECRADDWRLVRQALRRYRHANTDG